MSLIKLVNSYIMCLAQDINKVIRQEIIDVCKNEALDVSLKKEYTDKIMMISDILLEQQRHYRTLVTAFDFLQRLHNLNKK